MKREFKIAQVIFLLLGSLTSQAEVLKVHLKKDLPSFASTGKSSSLVQLKELEVQGKWKECSHKAERVFEQHKDVRGWVALVWIHCLSQEQKKNSDPMSLSKPLVKMGSQRELFQEGPWSRDLNSGWVDLRLKNLEEQIQKKKPRVMAALEDLLESFVLTKEQRARVFQGLGEWAFLRKDYKQAQFFYFQAQSQNDSKILQDKLDFIAKALAEKSFGRNGGDSKAEVTSPEDQHEDQMREYLRKGDTLKALKEVIVVLNKFPGSRAAKRLKDKPLEIYSAAEANKEACLSEMAEVDGARLLEWSQVLHRRADYRGSLSLAERAAAKEINSPTQAGALWVAGRSAHFLGLYDKALVFFDDLIRAHYGSEEAAEALLRVGLIHLRVKKYSQGADYFERLSRYPVSTLRERYDLQARYWWVRTLEGLQSDRAKSIAQEVITRYPYSYYGLRLSAESKDGKLTWPTVKDTKLELKDEIYLAGPQKKSWQRFKILSEAGWLNEARKELGDLPLIKNPLLKAQWALKLAELHQYSTAIRLLNEAIDQDPRLQREEFVKAVYPSAFQDLYKAESERYKIHIDLLRSLTRQESAFNPQAVSSSNAMGLMQMIPPTAQEIAKKLNLKIELPDDMFRPEVNIPMGSYYVSQMIGQFQGNVPFALAAYNAGPTRLKVWLEAREEVRQLLATARGEPENEIWIDELPWSETSFYVKAILRNVLLYRLASDGSFTLKPAFWQDLRDKKTN